jgi:hypothetical protein
LLCHTASPVSTWNPSNIVSQPSPIRNWLSHRPSLVMPIQCINPSHIGIIMITPLKIQAPPTPCPPPKFPKPNQPRLPMRPNQTMT